MPIKQPRKKRSERLPDLLVVIEQRNAVKHRNVEDVFRRYIGKEVLVRDANWIARGFNGYLSGRLASLPTNGTYELKTQGTAKLVLRCEYLMDMLVKKD